MAMNASRNMNLELAWGAGMDGRLQVLHPDSSTNVTATDRDRAIMALSAWNPQWHPYPGIAPPAAAGAGLHGKSTRIGSTARR